MTVFKDDLKLMQGRMELADEELDAVVGGLTRRTKRLLAKMEKCGWTKDKAAEFIRELNTATKDWPVFCGTDSLEEVLEAIKGSAALLGELTATDKENGL